MTNTENEMYMAVVRDRDALREEILRLRKKRIDDVLYWWGGVALAALLLWGFGLLHF